MSFRDEIKSALERVLHSEPSDAYDFLLNFKVFQDDLSSTDFWERELAIRDIFHGEKPFEWGYCEALDDFADPVASWEYDNNIEWCEEVEELCLFIKNIERYIN